MMAIPGSPGMLAGFAPLTKRSTTLWGKTTSTVFINCTTFCPNAATALLCYLWCHLLALEERDMPAHLPALHAPLISKHAVLGLFASYFLGLLSVP